MAIPGISQAQSSKKRILPRLGKSSITQVVKAMTLLEKAKLVTGMNGDVESLIYPNKVPGAAGRIHPVPRLGIPSIYMADGAAGIRINAIRNHDSSKTYYATAFPIETLLASTWDTSVVRKVGAALGGEAHEYGIDIMLLPNMDIQRNPLGGRNFEYYSEDPLLSGEMAAAMVKGIQSNGVGATLKHFAAYNQETSRHYINVIVGQRALREIYLKGFEIAVKQSRPWALMSSYNKLNGTFTAQIKDLLTDILRNEWGFKGFVMTDWGTRGNPVAEIKAGNDLIMPGHPKETQEIIEAVKKGNLSVSVLNRNVKRILKILLKTPTFKHYNFSNEPNLKKDANISRWAATQGMVLLKNNDHTLPLKNIKRIALFGYTSYDLRAGGTGSGHVDNMPFNISLAQGLSNAGYSVNSTLQSKYKNYLKREKIIMDKTGFYRAYQRHYGIMEMEVDKSLIKKTAKRDDIAIITIGRDAGEGRDRKVHSFYLSPREKRLIKNVSGVFHAQGKKVIVVLNIPGPIDVASWKNKVDAILLAWMPGEEGGNAITDILSGQVNPSGKLAQTFPVKYSDVPSAKHFPGRPAMNTQQVTYVDGIYVGYRYYNTFHIKTAYPFGYGLSYTHFTYSNLKLSSHQFNNKINVTVKIANSGNRLGKEVAELYLSAPAKQLKKPSEELKAFAKTKLLKPGESQIMKFTLTESSLASFNTQKEAWIAESGKYTVKIGTSSSDIKQKANFELAKDIIVEKVHKELVPKEKIPEFYPLRINSSKAPE
jgi:beta-glucosidase